MLAKPLLDQALIKARSHVKKGELAEAQELYQKILKNYSNNIRAQQGLASLNKNKEDSILQNPPQETVNQLANLYNQGQITAVIEQAEFLIAQYPSALIVWNILGASRAKVGLLDEAIEAYKKCISLKPDFAEVYSNMGVALKDRGRYEEAIEAYNKAIILKPNDSDIYYNMGITFKNQGRYDEAINAYKKAISLKLDHSKAYNNLGGSLHYQGKHDEAIEAYNKAISLQPNDADAYNNMGTTFKYLRKFDKALDAYNKALSIKPDHEITRAQKFDLLAQICDWDGIKEDSHLLPLLGTTNQFVSPFSLLALEDSPERHHTRSKIYAKAKYPQRTLPFPKLSSKTSKIIRIGYFSADFREHPVAYLIAKVLEKHNRDEFEVFGYSLHSDSQSQIRQRLVKSFDFFEDIQGMSDKDKMLRARQDKIDIAIDMTGYTDKNRGAIFAYRAAPIQINFLGYPGTIGADHIDYIVTDQFLVPPENQKYFTEKQIYLPNTYMPTDNSREISTRYMSKKEFNLPEDSFVFCCFNNNYKITSKEFDIWMRVLSKVEKSILWLRKYNLETEVNFTKEAIKRNIDPSRIVFAEKTDMETHLARHQLADLFLDTFNFNAHSTASEALWAGLPVVTKAGKGFSARVAASLLNAIDLPELITENEKEYEALILELATNPDKLHKIKEKLQTNRLSKPLFNTEQYTKNLEDGYRQAYQNYLKGNTPQNIIVK